jgi:MFS family permease
MSEVRGSVGLPVSQDASASKPCPSPGSKEPGEALASTTEAGILLSARGLRAVLDGLVSLVLPVYLLALGYGPLETGVIATATLAGSAVLTLTIGLFAHRASGRVLLMAVSLLMTLTGLAFAGFDDFWPLLVVAFIGTLNPSSGDVSAFLPLEQARLAHLADARERTRLFARYSFIGSVGAAVGALGAGLPELSVSLAGVSLKAAC